MSTPKPKKAARIATLERQLKEALADQVHNYYHAAAAATKTRFTARTCIDPQPVKEAK